MAYDGVPWLSSEQVSAAAYAPHAPLTAEALYSSLISAYAHARHAARLIATMAWPWNGQGTSALARGTHARFFSSTRQVLLRAHAFVDARWTHATATVIFISNSLAVSYSRHRLSAYNGSSTATGPETNRELPPGDFPAQAIGLWGPDLRNVEITTRYDACEVSLLSFERDQTIRFTLEGYVYWEVYRPAYALLALEVRD